MSAEPAAPPAQTPPAAPAKPFPLWRALLIAAGVLLACCVCLQLIPIDRTNPPVVSEPKWDSPSTRALAKRACFDCHSNETVWPWYSYVAPISWTVAFDVFRGRREMNFSEWPAGVDGSRAASRIERNVSDGEMPPRNYLLLHPDASLSAQERQQLIDGLKATLSQ